MGVMNWIRKKVLGFDVGDSEQLEGIVSSYLKNTMQQHAATLKTSTKLNQAQLLRLQEKQLREQLKSQLLDDGEEDDDDGEDEDKEGSLMGLFNALPAPLKEKVTGYIMNMDGNKQPNTEDPHANETKSEENRRKFFAGL